MKNKLWLLYPVLALLLAFSLAVPASADDPVPLPHNFYGSITIDTEPAAAGTEVEARGEGVMTTEANPITTTEEGQYGGPGPTDPKLEVQGYIDDGTPIEFYVDEVKAQCREHGTEAWLDSYPWHTGGKTELDLRVGVGLAPVAGFSANPLTGDEPLTVVFTDESENMAQSPTWSWDFGDGGTSTVQNPTHQYLQDGSYTVTLTVTTDEGSDSEVKADYIVVADTEPVASFTADPTSGERPLEVSFTDTSTSYDGIISYEWDFSYQEELTFQVESTVQHPPVYTYGTEGTYTVALRVTEDDTDSDMAEVLITVTLPTPPTVVSTSPLDTATNVAIDATVSATFDEDVTAIDLLGITISGATGVLATLDEATDTITIAHDDFAYETTYTVTIPVGAVNDLDGNPNAVYTWSFTTTVVDIIPPTVVSTTPEADATNQAIDVVVSATFSEDIEEGANFGDIDISGATVVSASIDGTTLTIAHADFDYETSYTVTIPAGAVNDLDDNPLAEAEVWSFTTGGEVPPPIATFTLSAGWNIISTPIALHASMDTWEEASAELDIDPLAITYYFDSSNQIWGQVLADYQLEPCDAIYVKMASEDTVSIIASTLPSVPSKQLYAGWNLVGLAYLPMAEDALPGMKANEALISVEEVTGGLTGYVQVVSPLVNQPPWIYTGGDIDDWVGESPPDGWMLISSGYWVFMLNDGILAGFTFTPISLN